jgi:hypothetical protein
MAKPGRPCSICSDPARNEFVNRRLADGYSSLRIDQASRTDEARELGVTPMKRETVTNHVRNHVAVGAPKDAPPEMQQRIAIANAKMAVGLADPNDVATLVRDEASQLLREGKLRITTQHALQAQQMLDRRVEKQKDRELQYAIAALMVSAQPPATIIDMTATEVGDQ